MEWQLYREKVPIVSADSSGPWRVRLVSDGRAEAHLQSLRIGMLACLSPQLSLPSLFRPQRIECSPI